MFKIAEILSSTYKIKPFSRFLGQNSIFNMFFDILNRYFKGFFMPKKHIFWRYKKIFSVQKKFWDFLYMYKVGIGRGTFFAPAGAWNFFARAPAGAGDRGFSI